MAYIGKSPTGTGVRSRYYFTATGGETSLSGADDNSNTLVFSDGNYVDVSLNGIALVAGTDYNTSTANTIAGLSALSASDIVEIVVYDIFTVADTVSAKDGGTFSGAITANSGLNVGTIKEATGTTTAMTIDSSGRILTPARPAFRVYGSLTAWVSFSSDVKVNNLTTVDYNIGSHYSTSDHEFTAPIAGLYHFSGHIYVNNNATVSDYYLSVDDASLTNNLYFASEDADQSDSTVTFGETLQLTANQTVSIKGSSGQYYPAYSSFGGYLIG